MTRSNERRTAPRFPLKINCRFLLRGEVEGKGSLLDISTNGLALIADSPAEEGDEIVVYPDGVGRLGGKIVRVFNGGVAIAFLLSDTQREIIGKRIESVIAGVPYLRLCESRSSVRISYNIETSARLEKSNDHFLCTIVDMSHTGCQLKSDARPEIGERVVIGALRGIVRRQTDQGFAIEFLRNSKPQQNSMESPGPPPRLATGGNLR